MPHISCALIVKDLNKIIIDSVDNERESFKQGLLKVISKNSGFTGDFNNNSMITSALAKAEQYIDSYQYIYKEKYNQLELIFNYDKVKSLITSSGLTLIEPNRPTILVIPTFFADGNNILVPSDSEIIAQLQTFSQELGINLLFPNNDLSFHEYDQEILFWESNQIKELVKASNYDQILILKYSRGISNNILEGSLLQGEERINLNYEDEHIGKNNLRVANFLVANMSKNSFVDDNENNYIASFLGVNGIEGYNTLMSYLSQKREISNIKISKVDENMLSFNIISSHSDLEALGKQIQKDLGAEGLLLDLEQNSINITINEYTDPT